MSLRIDTQLTPQEVTRFLKGINSSAGFTRMSVHDLANNTRRPVFVLRDNSEPIGIQVCEHISNLWTELHVLYVIPEKRSHGHGQRLFTTALEENNDRNIFLTTNNALVKHMAVYRLSQYIASRTPR